MFNPNGQTTLYCLDAAGNFHRLIANIQSLGPRSDLLMSAASEEGTTIHNFARIGELPVHLYAARVPAYAVRLPFLRIRTQYRVIGAGANVCLVPWFERGDTLDLTCEWTPPYNCDLFFVYRENKCYLVAGYTNPTGARSIRRIPMPNVYGDGRICMGQWRPNPEQTILDQLNSAITNFTTSEWNGDLLEGNRPNLNEFLRFSIDGRRQLPANYPWHNFSPVISGASYNWVAELMQGLPVEPVAPVVVPAPTPVELPSVHLDEAVRIMGARALDQQTRADHDILRALATNQAGGDDA